MYRRGNRLIFLTLTLLALTLYWSCSDPDDVLTAISSSKVTLSAERLPTPPAGMVYELWVADAEDTVSLGKFTYDQDEVKYFEVDGTTERTSEFYLDDDFDRFSHIFVSVEVNPDDDLSSPGPIMLYDQISDDPIDLLFPEADTLWRAVVRFNMEGVSDNNRDAGDGRGVWFSSYTVNNIHVLDTIGFTYRLDSTGPHVLELECDVDDQTGETLSCDTVNKRDIFCYKTIDGIEQLVPCPYEYDSVWTETVPLQYGGDTLLLYPDTLWHVSLKFIIDSMVPVPDSLGRYYKRDLFSRFRPDTIPHDYLLDLFTQDDFGLPDLSAWGWKYKGWIVTPNIDTTVVDTRINPPAWRYNTINEHIIPGDRGGLLTTGKFTNVEAPDEANPFVSDPSIVPPYPGEDFLDLSAIQDSFPSVTDLNQVYPLRFTSGNEGTVFITLEPDNFVSRNNFPLYAFIRDMPEFRAQVTGDLVQLTMRNWTQSLRGDLYGFPRISVAVEKY